MLLGLQQNGECCQGMGCVRHWILLIEFLQVSPDVLDLIHLHGLAGVTASSIPSASAPSIPAATTTTVATATTIATSASLQYQCVS